MSEIALVLSIVALGFAIWTTYHAWKLRKQLKPRETLESSKNLIEDSLGDD